jgi:hypothetical protein
MEMLGGVLALGVVATTDVAALLAQPKVDPAHAGRETFLAAVGCARSDVADGGGVGALRRHGWTLLLECVGRIVGLREAKETRLDAWLLRFAQYDERGPG